MGRGSRHPGGILEFDQSQRAIRFEGAQDRNDLVNNSDARYAVHTVRILSHILGNT